MESTPDSPPGNTAGGRWGVAIAAFWLFFMMEPIHAAWQHRDGARGLLGLATVGLFVVVYLCLWARRRRLPGTLRQSVAWLAALLVVAVALTLLVGPTGLVALTYCAIGAVLLLPVRWAAGVVVGLAAITATSGALVPGWGSQTGLTFAILAASLAVFGVTRLIASNTALARSRDENARLAVEAERARVARDLHDILGHSLTVITVKAELAHRLLDVDPTRTRAELEDLERLSREALRDVRMAVAGFREMSVAGELVRARQALSAAGIDADLPHSVEDVSPDLRELFAWAVREGVTNVIRHSHATRCEVALEADAVRITDNGPGPSAEWSDGSGLIGLRERAAACGADLTVTSDHGFMVEVARR